MKLAKWLDPVADFKQTLRAEMAAQFAVVNNKLDQLLLKIMTKRDQKLDGK